MDTIYEYMEATDGVSKQEMDRFREYIQSEKYDTDSLFYDIFDSFEASNILLNVCLTKYSIFGNTLCQYIKYLQSMYQYIYS